MKGVTFEKDANGKDRYVRFDLKQYAEELRPLLDKIGYSQPPEGWEEALTSEEFFEEAKKMLRRKFDERSKIR